MKTIICAIDYSSSSIFALKYAAEICRKTTGSFVVIHIYRSGTLGSNLDEPNFLLEEEIAVKKNTQLKVFCVKYLGNDFLKLNCKTEAIKGNSTVKEINSKALTTKATLIVVGMKGIDKFKDFFLGNTTKKLIEKAICPILAVPNEFEEYSFKTFVYATDFKKEDIYAIQYLSQIAEKFNSTLKIVHIYTEKDFKGAEQMDWFKELVKQKVEYKNLKFKIIYSDDILNTLHVFLEKNNASLIAMLERKKTGIFSKLTHGDLVKKLESYINIPLLSFNEEYY